MIFQLRATPGQDPTWCGTWVSTSEWLMRVACVFLTNRFILISSLFHIQDKFEEVYNRLTLGRRDMKAFFEFCTHRQGIEDKYAKVCTLFSFCTAPF